MRGEWDMPKARAKKTAEEELQESYERWQRLYKNGGSDPFWPDGMNLNLVRNHILYYRNQIKQEHPDGHYPSIYYQSLPPEVDSNCMITDRKLNSLIQTKRLIVQESLQLGLF